MSDPQNQNDTRGISINRVGIKDISHPIQVNNRDGSTANSIATFSMSVDLPEHKKGVSMSRFVQLLNDTETVISAKHFHRMLNDTVQRMEAEAAYIELQFPYFMEKTAPVSKLKSVMDYQVNLIGQLENGHLASTLEVTIPVKSFCPTGNANNGNGQRSHITVGINCSSKIWLEELIKMVEAQASAELFAALENSDEQHIVDAANNNAKSVEDVVRDVAIELDKNDHISRYYVHAENFESNHNHSTFAVVEYDKTL